MSGNDRPLAEVRGGVVPRPGAMIDRHTPEFAIIVKSDMLNDTDVVDPGLPKFLESLSGQPRIVCFSGRWNTATGEKDDNAKWAGRVSCTSCGWFALNGSFTNLSNMIPKRCVDSPRDPHCPAEKVWKHRASRGIK